MVYLLPEKSQDHDPNSLVLEVTAGVGGQEAMLFAAELLDMYQGYIAYRGWEHDRAEIDLSELGGLRHGTLSVNGRDCFTDLRQEGGVHRVQRVPKTEKSGRLHTSTVTVAVLPQPSEVAITLNPKDLKIETKRSSGAGGQHVNTTDSCVRLTYLPTGMVVECQTERSQVQNKAKAMQWLRARLFQQKLETQQADIRGNRKQQVGSSFRSEKIRTYNFPQDRVTDHRVGVTMHNLKGFMTDGGEPLYDLHTQLKILENREQFKLFLNSLAKESR
ncbi:hypothetical protein B566_EDAN006699 [Ephemera danica]|nr:hypothetical protein B566_EDAN006699 [Ephemera danica]